MVKPTSEVHSTAFNVMDLGGKSKSLSKSGGDSQSRTGTAVKSRRILSPLRLPVPPYPLGRSCRYKVERVKGIEPSQPAWKAGTLPLSYTRIIKDSFIWGIWGVGVKDFLWILLPSGIGPSVFVFNFVSRCGYRRMGFEQNSSKWRNDPALLAVFPPDPRLPQQPP
jgi:hypothetical protein